MGLYVVQGKDMAIKLIEANSGREAWELYAAENCGDEVPVIATVCMTLEREDGYSGTFLGSRFQKWKDFSDEEPFEDE